MKNFSLYIFFSRLGPKCAIKPEMILNELNPVYLHCGKCHRLLSYMPIRPENVDRVAVWIPHTGFAAGNVRLHEMALSQCHFIDGIRGLRLKDVFR